MKLSATFEIEKYGLYARLIDETDAEFIIQLRNQDKARFMNAVLPDTEKQKEWIKEYKNREQAGLDYYFIYYKNGLPLGLNRIYKIRNDSFVGGSLVFSSKCEFEIPILATLIQLHIGFEIMDKSICFGNIHKNNKIAIKFNRLLGNDFIYEDENELFIVLSKRGYLKTLNKYEGLF